jgi:hypothetical protein
VHHLQWTLRTPITSAPNTLLINIKEDKMAAHRSHTMDAAAVLRGTLKKDIALDRADLLLVAMAAAQDTHNNQVELSIRRQGRDQQVLPIL